MRNVQKEKWGVLIAAIVIPLLPILIAGCDAKESSQTGLESSDNVSHASSADHSNEASRDLSEIYFPVGDDRVVHIISEDITAYYDVMSDSHGTSTNPKFGLAPLSDEFPSEAVTYGPPVFDWSDYQHRLSKAEYHFIIHSSLKSEVNTIVHRNLFLDGVVHGPSFIDILPLPQIQWLNSDVFDKFVNENVIIDFVEDLTEVKQSGTDDFSISTSDLTWQVYEGGCFQNFDSSPMEYVCYQHAFEIWLVSFSDDYRIIWDMKYIVESGCGRPLDHLAGG